MPEQIYDSVIHKPATGAVNGHPEHRRQEALLKTGALQNAILHSANFSIIATDEKGIIQLFNSGAERMLGYRAAEVVNRIRPSDIHEPQEVLARAQALSLELATPITPGFEALAFKASRGIEDSYELTYIRKDGSRFPAIVSITALRDDHDDIIGYLLIGTDNTARQREKEALCESEERYRTLFESIDEGFCLIEMIFDRHKKPVDYRFLEVNPSFEKQAGMHVIAGDRMRELSPDHEEHWFEIYGNVALTGEPIRFVNEAKTLGGRWFDVYAFRVGARNSCKVAVLFTDITERKHLDQALQDKNADLERARFVAEKANRAKSDFLSCMSHELRTPLNAILGFAQLMESGSPLPTPVQKTSIGQILQAGWYLLELVNEILDLTLIEAGRLSLSQEPVPLMDFMLKCQAMIEPLAQKNGIRVSFPRIESPCFVKADRTRLKQVLINLLSNAIKYNRAQGTVEVSCRLKTAQRLRISVRDSGEGLSPDKLAQLFQPFNRLGQETSAEEGTGIGLVVSKQLVELMDGEIGVESSVGVGSVFWIELNVAEEPRPSAGSGQALEFSETELDGVINPGSLR